MNGLTRNRGFLVLIAVSFLNAFVDLGHKIVVQNAVFKIYDGSLQIGLTAAVNAMILLPFILLLSPAGFLSDRFAKNAVMRLSAAAAVAITLAITGCYYLGWFWPAFILTFILAVQSAIYSPAKYGYIKELCGKGQLAAANGAIQAITTFAILLGTFAFSILFERRLAGAALPGDVDGILRSIAPVGWLLVAGASLEFAMCYFLPTTRGGDRTMKFDWPAYRRGRYLAENLTVLRSETVIRLSIIGLALFWAIAQVMLAAFPAFAKESLGTTNTVVIQGMMACAGVGILFGSILAGRLSQNRIETGFLPLAAFGVTGCLLVLPSLGTVLAHGINFFLLGMLGGLFIIPLNALIQFHAADNALGRVLAVKNLVQNVVMLAFLGLTIATAFGGLSVSVLFALLFIVALVGSIYTLYKLPQSLLRLLISRVFAMKYRLRVIGFEHFPERGGVLMLGNHISWIDWAIVQMAAPRPVRFVMERSIYNRWYLKWFMDLVGVIPISRGGYTEALDMIRECLGAGEVVCLFPEGTLSRTGQLNEFKRGFEKAAAGADGVILPFYLRGLWGSRFSQSSPGFQARRTARRRDITVAFGAPMDIDSDAPAVKQRVSELSISAWQDTARSFEPIVASWLRSARAAPRRRAVIESTGQELSSAQLLTAVVAFALMLNLRGKTIGLLLPASAGGVIANLACLLKGRTVANLNYTASQEAIQLAMKKAGIRTVLTSRRFVSRLEKRGIDLSGLADSAELVYLEDVRSALSAATKVFAFALARFMPVSLLIRMFGASRDADAVAAILFSSGSEGTPKGIMLSHRNIVANVKQVADVLNAEGDDIVMGTLPLFHAFGLTVTTFMPLLEGMPVVCHPDPTDALNAAKAIARYRATLLCGSSTFLRLYVRNRRIHPLMLQSLRLVVAGAERLDPAVRESFKLKFNKEIYEGYGATETTPVASANVPDHLDPNTWKLQEGSKIGTVGLPLPGSSFRIVDPETLQALSPGEDGLILIGGVQVMVGYLDDPEKTADVIAELDGQRWYKTGDKGHIDEDGFLTIVDRYSRFAKLGGEMVSLSAVEDQIRRVVENDEAEFVAVAVPDPKKGERIVALAEQGVDIDALKQRMLDNQTNPLMVPSEFIAVESIPKLGSGKTDMVASKRLAAELVAAVEDKASA